MGKQAKPLALLALSFVLTACGEQAAQDGMSQAPQAMPIETSILAKEAVQLVAELPGRTVAFRQSDVRPQVDGIIVKRNFTEGAYVEEGQQLYLIDQAVYLANLDAAKADLSRQASTLEQATRTRVRYQGLLKRKSVSKDDFDNAVSSEARAKAALEAAKAQVKKAEIALEYTQVKAPISGKIGASTFTEGALVTAGQGNALATITQLDPIYVDVTQAGSRLLKLKQTIKSGKLDLADKQHMSVSLIIDSTGGAYPHEGELEFADVLVNETTGTVRLRALFPNPDGDLLPGMFVRGKVAQGIMHDAFLIPQHTVMRRPDGAAYVYVVGADNKVETRDVTIEQSLDQNWIISGGLDAGQHLIINGLQLVAPGMLVAPYQTTAQQ